ncbi:MAG TPA: hypothetical protein VHS59_05675 [Bacillota bacterium]|nr:hypothetical protein [Bacillota bacterium]
MPEAGFFVSIYIGLCAVFGLTWLLTVWLLPRFTLLLKRGGLVRANYQGECIPASLGLVFFCGILPGTLVVGVLQEGGGSARLGVWLWGLGAMALAGFLDDAVGDRSVTGLKGHLMALITRGELTTGMVKAAVGLMVGVGGVFMGEMIGGGVQGNFSLGSLLLHLLVIVLNINLRNLLDLRPGRAGKFFLVAVLALISVVGLRPDRPEIFWLVLLTASVLAYLPADLEGRVMMGDSGSNLLGVSLGLTSAWLLPEGILLVEACGLVAVHIFAERYSISRLVERVAFLRFLDGLGRPRN